MKKTISICLFTVMLAICIAGGILILDIKNRTKDNRAENRTETERVTETDETEFVESMQVQKAYCYLLIAEDDRLVVYEQDGRTILLETNIRLHALDEEKRRLLQEGIWISDEQELYDLLESYSS